MNFIRSNGVSMFCGLLVCGVIGYFIADSDGRALGGGIGAAIGLIVGGWIGKPRK